jgi:hypothetical protein
LRSNKQTQHALPQERTRANAKGAELCDAGSNATHLAGCRTVIHFGVEPNCQTQINPGERGFYYPGDKSLYGSRCRHGEKAERDFAAHRIDEDGF